MTFSPGMVVVTATAQDVLTPMDMADMLSRHLAGDWGDVCQEDKESNDLDVIHGNRLISAYHVNDIRVCIITEADRSSTTILLPSDY